MSFYMHIKPTFNCIAKFNSCEQLLTKNKMHTFLVNYVSPIALSFYPTDEENKNSLPFACTLTKTEQTLQTNKKEVEIISFPNNNFLVLVKPFVFNYPTSFENVSTQINFGLTNHTLNFLKMQPCEVFLTNNKNNNSLNLPIKSKITALKTKVKNNILFAYAQTENNTFLTFCVKYENEKYYLLSLKEVDLLEEENNEIKTYTFLNDLAGHGEIVTYTFEPEFNEEITLAYNNSAPLIAKHKEIIPHAFFQALKVKNFKLARSYLTKNLSKKLSNTHLEVFFGEFDFTHQTLSPTFTPEEIALVYSYPYKHAKIFSLTINEENKIENITEN